MDRGNGIDHSQLGHLYVIDGDIQQLAVDAWLLPTDGVFNFTSAWGRTLSQVDDEVLSNLNWKNQPCIFLANVNGADVWLGDVGRHEAPVAHYIDRACQFVRYASERCRANPSIEHRVPIVALPHLGTGAGGGHAVHGQILQRLIATLTEELNEGRLLADIVLVAWGEQPESAAQYFRLNLSDDWRRDKQWDFGARTDLVHETAVNVTSHLKSRRLATFLGAGTSVGAGLPGWNELLNQIAISNGVADDLNKIKALNDPRDRASFVDRRLMSHPEEPRRLHQFLKDYLHGSRYSLQHGLIASLPCNEYITTNVDELFEMACRTNERKITVMPGDGEFGERWLLKIHGTLSEPDNMVFTRDNYLDVVRNSRALFGLVQAMLFTRHMLFIGYGLADEDFHEIVYDVRRAVGSGSKNSVMGTVILLNEEPYKAEIWSDTLNVVPVGTTPDNTAQNSRDVARFLDLVGMLSAEKYRFFLDDRYAHEMFADDQELQNALNTLAKTRSSANSVAWKEVQKLLDILGYNGS